MPRCTVTFGLNLPGVSNCFLFFSRGSIFLTGALLPFLATCLCCGVGAFRIKGLYLCGVWIISSPELESWFTGSRLLTGVKAFWAKAARLNPDSSPWIGGGLIWAEEDVTSCSSSWSRDRWIGTTSPDFSCSVWFSWVGASSDSTCLAGGGELTRVSPLICQVFRLSSSKTLLKSTPNSSSWPDYLLLIKY